MEIDKKIMKYQKGLIPKEVFFETIEKQYRKRIVGFLLAISPSPEKVDDIYQEFILRIYQKIDSVSNFKNFEGWLFKIARNIAFDILKSSAEREKNSAELPQDKQAPGPGPKTENIQKEIQDLVNQALNGIKPEYREIIFLKFHAHQTFESISTITGIPLTTVKNRFEKGMKLLDTVLKSLKPD